MVFVEKPFKWKLVVNKNGMETNQTRLCKCCGDRLRGRIDKMYCDDRCRNQFHNKEKKRPGLTELARSIQQQLMKNRTILQRQLRGRKACMIDRDRLLREGFSFDLITHRNIGKNGKETRYCYEFGYRCGLGNRVELGYRGGGVGIFR